MEGHKEYVGKFCFLERLSTSGDVEYGSGEYLVVDESPNVLYCIKPVGGYEGHELRSFPMVGQKKWTVVNTYRDKDRARILAKELLAFSDWKAAGHSKPNWIESVYSGAKNNADRIMKAICEPFTVTQGIGIKDITITYADGSSQTFTAK